MDNQQKPVWKHAFSYGLGTGAVLIIISLIIYLLDVNTFENKWTGWIGYAALFVGTTLSAIHYRDKFLNGYITYGKSFSIHFMTGLFAGIIAGIFSIFFMMFAGDDIRQMALDNAEKEVLKAKPDASDQEIEMALKMTKLFLKPVFMGILAIISYSILSVIYGLIASIFVKKEDKSLDSAA
jgi:hypothetical protein